MLILMLLVSLQILLICRCEFCLFKKGQCVKFSSYMIHSERDSPLLLCSSSAVLSLFASSSAGQVSEGVSVAMSCRWHGTVAWTKSQPSTLESLDRIPQYWWIRLYCDSWTKSYMYTSPHGRITRSLLYNIYSIDKQTYMFFTIREILFTFGMSVNLYVCN